MLYGLVSVIVGIIVGISAARKYMENLFGTLSLCFMVTILSVGISLPLNYCFFDGMTGNIWGDGVIEVLTKLGFHSGISHFAGQFYMDFLDKVFTIVVLFLSIRLYRRMREMPCMWVNSRKTRLDSITLESMKMRTARGASRHTMQEPENTGSGFIPEKIPQEG